MACFLCAPQSEKPEEEASTHVVHVGSWCFLRLAFCISRERKPPVESPFILCMESSAYLRGQVERHAIAVKGNPQDGVVRKNNARIKRRGSSVRSSHVVALRRIEAMHIALSLGVASMTFV